MKKLISTLSFVTLLALCSGQLFAGLPSKNLSASDTISVWTSSELLPLTNLLINKYAQEHPQVSFRLIADADVMQEHSLNGNLGFVKQDVATSNVLSEHWMLTIGRDILVPVVNNQNPYLAEIMQYGINKEGLSQVLSNSKTANWSDLLGGEQGKNAPCKNYGSPQAKSVLAGFLQTNDVDLALIETKDVSELFQKIENDKYAIGFCKLADMIDPANASMISMLAFAPLDVNGNRQVDYFENIYQSTDNIARGIWIGKYPKALYDNVYCVANAQPTSENQVAFLEWVLTDGQEYLMSSGFSELVSNERKSKAEQFIAVDYTALEPAANSFQTSNWLLLSILILAALLFTINLIGIFRTTKPAHKLPKKASNPTFFSDQTIKAPGGLFFDKSHTWAFMEKTGFVRVGVDDFLQHVTGAITKVKMKQPGDKIRKGEFLLSLIQQGKQLDIYSPVSGTVMENNSGLDTSAGLINESPFGEGWVYVVESDNWVREIKSLIMQEPYLNWIQKEFIRLKDFVAFQLASESSLGNKYVMQEGGELKDHLLEEFDPKVWEEFQNKFINTAY